MWAFNLSNDLSEYCAINELTEQCVEQITDANDLFQRKTDILHTFWTPDLFLCRRDFNSYLSHEQMQSIMTQKLEG